MPGRIVVLPEDLTNKIAAGEVIERPASILKELLENALDAGATDLLIELENGGCGSIKVVDNGEGIERADAALAFERYATSKIYQFDDIYKVKSFGFRGEALPSIASIARVELITKIQSAMNGTKVIVENGEVVEVMDAGCPAGTNVRVDHIFDSVPVRKKFLKSDTTEQGYCMDAITRMALSHPDVRMKVMARGKIILSIPATKDLTERISLILGVDFMDHILHVEGMENDIKIEGFVSKPEFTRSSNKHMYYYVNRRFIRDYLVNHAVMTVYGRLMEARRYPSVVLFIDLPPDDVDVNVHPTKMEVRFRNPRNIYDAILKVLAGLLADISPIADLPASGISSGISRRAGIERYHARIEDAMKRYRVSSGSNKLFFDRGLTDTIDKQDGSLMPKAGAPDLPPEVESFQKERIRFADLEYMGQVAGTYLIFSSFSAIVIIDQHAAHERLLFEKLKSEAQAPDAKVIGQGLLIPEILSLTPKDFSFLMEGRRIFADAGIDIEPFGGDAVAIKSLPALLSHVAPKEIIIDMLEEFSETERLANLNDKKEKIFALLACKGAIKANQNLSSAEVAALCKDLDATPFSSTCPHGRPVHISFSIRDMEKMFRRK